MNNRSIALFGLIIGSLLLSLELFMLKIIQGLDVLSGSWSGDIMVYANDFPCNIAFLITFGVIIYSSYTLYRSYNN